MIVRLTFDVLIKHFNRVFYLKAFECAYTPTGLFSFFCQLSHSLSILYLCLITFDLSVPFVPNFLCSAFIQPSVFSPSTLKSFCLCCIVLVYFHLLVNVTKCLSVLHFRRSRCIYYRTQFVSVLEHVFAFSQTINFYRHILIICIHTNTFFNWIHKSLQRRLL